MPAPADECFGCQPRPVRAVRQRRSLCLRHKTLCRVETGELLETVLAWVTPAEHPLEGSMLAYVYNPVFVDVGDESMVKGWTDFAAGGMAVFEDRFGARDLVEVRAFSDLETRRLLRTIAAHGTAFPAPTWRTRLRRWMGRTLPGPDDLERLFVLWSLWQGCQRVQRHRAAAARMWPRSFAELLRWLELPAESNSEPVDMTSSEFDAFLLALALRCPAVYP